MDTQTLKKKTATPSATRAVAPDDLRRGDYLAVTHTTYQVVLFSDNAWDDKLKTQDIRLIPMDAGETFRILAVCLPFVFVRIACGGHRTLDLRRHHIRRLDNAYGKQAFVAQRDKEDDKNSRKKRKRRKKRRKRKRKGA